MNFGDGLEESLLTSSIKELQIIGEKLEIYEYQNFNSSRVIGLLKNDHYVFSDINSYLLFFQHRFNISEQIYVLEEQVRKIC